MSLATAPQPKTGALESAVDRLVTHLTVPRESRAVRVRLYPRGSTQAVERDLWLLHVRYHRHRRAADRSELVARYAEHARHMARRFHRHREPLDDLEQIAMEGLLLAIDRFDPYRGMPFLGFANPTISGCLKRFYRDSGWGIRVPRRVHDLSRPLRDAWDQLAQDLGRTPTLAELADLVDIDEAEVSAALEAESARTTGSLDAPSGDDSALADRVLGRLDGELARAENRHALGQVLVLLDGRDRELLGRYFEDGLTQAQIAESLGVSQMQISRSLRRILAQLRSHLPAG